MAVIQCPTKVDLDLNSNNYFKEGNYWNYEVESPEGTVGSVALHLEQSLRAAKKVHLSCGEVLLPPDLLTRVANDVLRMADTEPCGLKGALILLNFQSGPSDSRREITSSNSSLNSNSSNGSSPDNPKSAAANSNVRNIGKVKWDSHTATTFELHLTLKEDPTPWYSRLPQILRNLTNGGTIVVSPGYMIAKKKLYRSQF